MDAIAMLLIALALVAYGLVSRRLDGTVLTGPMLFCLFGLLSGSAYLDLIDINVGNEALHILAEVTLILVLFSDAASIDLVQLRRDHNLPVRMLLVGMPLTIVLGTIVALLMFDSLGIWEAALLAAILAPTDAALGQAVVSNPQVPLRIRQTLNVESGLNDGIALPFVLMFLAFAGAATSTIDAGEWLMVGAKQVTFGPLAGLLIGYVGARLVAACHRAGWMSELAEGMIALGLAFGAYALAETVHGNGFIAAFVAGLTFGNTLRKKCKYLYEFAESEGQILVLLTFAAFGAVMLPQAIGAVTTACLVFALLALTLLRMLPVQLSLLGIGARPVTIAFLGWFGPRGLASILFVLLIVEQSEIANADLIFTVVTVTVALSILLHGVTAGPLARWYGSITARMGECPEKRPVGAEPFIDQ